MALTKISSNVIANNTIAVGNIADNSVDATKIASNSILTRHIDDNQIGIDQLNVSDGSSGQALTTNGSGTLSFANAGETNRLPLAGGTLTGALVGTSSTMTEGFLGGSNGGIRIHSGGTKFFNITAANAARDNIMDIGASDARFKDLYLGGGVYLGGTGSANKLADYEEGTWTPTFSGATLSTAVGSYTKIGNQVTVHYRIVTTGGLPSSGTQVQIGGLPFDISNATINSVASGFGGAGSIYVGPSNVSSATGGGGTIVTFASGGESFLRLVNVDTGTLGYTLMGELEVSANNVITAIGTQTYQV